MDISRGARVVGLIAVTMVSVFLVFPLVVLIGTSVSTTEYLMFPPQGVTFRWFAEVLSSPEWRDGIVISAQIAAVATVISAAIVVPAALGLVRGRLRLRGIVESALTLPMLVPQIVLGVGLLQWLLALGVGRTLVGFVLAHVVLAFPFVLRSVLAVLVGMPQTFERAASDLGATPWRRFWHVTLPLLRPGLGAGCMFGFGISYINVEVSMFLATPELTPLPVRLLNYVAYTVDTTVSAVSALTIVIAFAALIVLDRVTGLERVGATR
ncbi:putative spermidine/putrescine transport system permease protein [Tamaricihabitans halophyticus]|uniref:Putative spermidine/putrescine transport system permease protein n=1 Tax=Tamaricihabitans halophyticus TaxID=1262583 RepID=A0A4R2R609_9PSEU|nr:ABC transporter permease [Tamaricihabitans halophyticus]TCP57474.1 putative spermidine/putrescine transport system permease protein [Tamaricihabitans halophyticus]